MVNPRSARFFTRLTLNTRTHLPTDHASGSADVLKTTLLGELESNATAALHSGAWKPQFR